MTISDSSLRLAIKNVATFGDTDVFPVPIEKHWFSEQPDVVFNLLKEIRDDFESATRSLPIFSSTELTNVGYFGFRSATQIDPLWNAFFLAAVIEVAPAIEVQRQSRERVFSYRFSPDTETGSLFSNCGWRDFHKQGLNLARTYEYVGVVDISDFYPRIYHHRLENVLRSVCACDGSVVKTIDTILRKLNSGISFGLPVGGPASRILAEALLVRSDRLLEIRKIQFLRFVDDYIVFGKSEDDVRTTILELSRILLDNEGLSLNRNKIKIYPSGWYIKQSVFANTNSDLPKEQKAKRAFFSTFVRFDPYSDTAEEDYEELKKQVKEHHVLDMLISEVDRTPIDIYAVRQLIKSIEFMEYSERSRAFSKLSECIERLAPVFTSMSRTFMRIMDELECEDSALFFSAVRKLVESRQPLIGASGTLAFAIQLLAFDPNKDSESTLQQIFSYKDRTPVIEREIILAMGRRGVNSWISDLRNRFNGMSNPWSKRALLVASFSLGDEGKHWRKSVKKDLPEHDKLFLEWISSKNNGTMWNIPL